MTKTSEFETKKKKLKICLNLAGMSSEGAEGAAAPGAAADVVVAAEDEPLVVSTQDAPAASAAPIPSSEPGADSAVVPVPAADGPGSGTAGATGESGEADDEDDEKDAVAKEDVKLELSITNEFDKVPYPDIREQFLTMVSLKAPFFRTEDRAPIDLIAIVDESGSMAGERIALVRETVMFIIKNLESNDRFGIVGYESRIRDVLPLTKMSPENKAKALQAAGTLTDRGGTALCAGLLRGLEMMKDRKGTSMNEVASVMLFTDGQANEGPQTSPEIIRCARDLIAGREVSMKSAAAPRLARKSKVKSSRMKKKKSPVRSSQKKVATISLTTTPTTSTPSGTPATTAAAGEPSDVAAESEEQSALNCVINTFGFGSGHKAALLQDIAEFGRGMYSYIAKADEIADVFAECLGGLVSTVAQDISVEVQPMSDGVEIKDLLSKGYAMRRMSVSDTAGGSTAGSTAGGVGGSAVQIKLKDIQSEEKRDLVFSLKLPAMVAEAAEYPLLKVKVAYNNCVREIHEDLEQVSMVARVGDDVAIGERNYELDLQYNRLLAAQAMDEADRLAEAGDLSQARTKLKIAQDKIKVSKSAAADYSQKLVQDMETASHGLRDAREYSSKGSKVLKMSSKAHYSQRAVSSSSYASQDAYASRKKKKMKSKFRR